MFSEPTRKRTARTTAREWSRDLKLSICLPVFVFDFVLYWQSSQSNVLREIGDVWIRRTGRCYHRKPRIYKISQFRTAGENYRFNRVTFPKTLSAISCRHTILMHSNCIILRIITTIGVWILFELIRRKPRLTRRDISFRA